MKTCYMCDCPLDPELDGDKTWCRQCYSDEVNSGISELDDINHPITYSDPDDEESDS